MKKLNVFIVVIIFFSFFAVIKIFFIGSPDGKKTPASSNTITTKNVTIYVAKKEILNDKLFVTGTVIANEEIMLMPEISGKIIQLNIKEGSEVEKNELLVKINDADFQAQLKRQTLQIALEEEKLDRLKQLLTINGISQEEYDIAKNQLNTLQADKDYTKAQISKTEIRSPFNGVIGLKNVSEGAFVSPSTIIASIQQLNRVKIDFSIPEKYVEAVGKDDLIRFTVSNNNLSHKATIYAIEPKIDPSTRTLRLRAIAENKDRTFFSGVTAKIEVPLKRIDDAIVIPSQAIIPVLKGQKVFICKNGKAQEVEVETGVRSEIGIQILSGIAAGDSVITSGIMQLKSGSPVKAIAKEDKVKN